MVLGGFRSFHVLVTTASQFLFHVSISSYAKQLRNGILSARTSGDLSWNVDSKA